LERDKELDRQFAWLFQWFDFSQNPIIEAPREGDWVADPTVVIPQESPDGKWHLFCSGKGIKHFVSDDGFHWVYLGLALQEGYSPFLFRESDTFWLFYQVSMGKHRETAIVCRSSKDLQNWSERKIG